MSCQFSVSENGERLHGSNIATVDEAQREWREGAHWDGIHMYKIYECQRRLAEKYPGVCWAALMEIPAA